MIYVTFEIDWQPHMGWSASLIEPKDFQLSSQGASEEKVCELVYSEATAILGQQLVANYQRTPTAWRKAYHDDSHRSNTADCPLCNNNHPDHEAALRDFRDEH